MSMRRFEGATAEVLALVLDCERIMVGICKIGACCLRTNLVHLHRVRRPVSGHAQVGLLLRFSLHRAVVEDPVELVRTHVRLVFVIL